MPSALDGLRIWEDTEYRSAAGNMALDEALATIERQPVLRVYRWSQPSVTFGYFCDYAAVAADLHGRDHARRWTGGGIVEHGSDITLALVVPRIGAWATVSSSEFYCWLHRRVATAVTSTHTSPLVMARLVGRPAAPGGTCFTSPVTSDLMADGTKVVGGAIRRTRDVMLYQGSIQGIAAASFHLPTLVHALTAQGNDAQTYLPPVTVTTLATTLTRKKYATQNWNTLRQTNRANNTLTHPKY